jgi:hypothetical protein
MAVDFWKKSTQNQIHIGLARRMTNPFITGEL